MEGKKKNSLLLIGVATLIVALIGASFAYFVATLTNSSTPISVTTTQLANLTMTSIKSDTTPPIYPGWVGFQGIDVQATGSGKAIYDLTLNITGGTNIKNDVQIEVCKIEDTTTVLAANQVTFTAATPTVSNNQYYMTGGVVTLPTGCTSVIGTSTLTSLGASVKISDSLGKELNSGYRDRYYIKITYVNNPSAAQVQGETFTITPSISTKAELDTPPITCETTPDSGTYAACNPASMTVGQRVKISADGQPDQYFRYIRTTDNGVTSLNECQSGTYGASSACTDTDANGKVGIPGAGYIRLLGEYNLNVGDNQYKENNVVVNDGIQDEHVFGYKNGVTTNGNIAFGRSVSYAASDVKTYVEAYASILNTRYGVNVTGSAITKAELDNLGCSESSWTCSGAPSWLYNTSYWSGSASNTDDVWRVGSFASASFRSDSYNSANTYGVRAVVQIAVSDL